MRFRNLDDLSIESEPAVGHLRTAPTGLRDGVWPDTLRRWTAGDTAHAPAGAESFDAIRRRVVPVWHRLTTEWDGHTLVVVAHGVVNRVLLLSLLPGLTVADWHRIRTSNVGVNELVRDGDAWRALRLDEVPAAAQGDPGPPGSDHPQPRT